MNDIMNVSNILYTILYADDTCAVMSGNDLPDLIKLLHTELCKINYHSIHSTFYSTEQE